MICKILKKGNPPLPPSLISLKKELKKKRLPPASLTIDEQKMIENIKKRTRERNKNNITRTKAYLDFYLEFPEVRWAFLGHMVSRNGGWNMTDLKGSFLSRFLTEKEAEHFFQFLERGNWLIFQDVFPQFLLYEKSVQKGKNLFHLLPFFHVSSFMQAVWNHFWHEKDEYILAVALIINEQSFLEQRVIQNSFYQKQVLNKIEFQLQDVLGLNHILFPYEENKKTKLAGASLHHFGSLHERILLGKKLYKILFGNPSQTKLFENWARTTPHTGSRKDYWPHIFHFIDEGTPSPFLKKRLKKCQIHRKYPRFYSPKLTDVWKDVMHEPAEKGDWYTKWTVIYYLLDEGTNREDDIENIYCRSLEKLELAAIAKKAIFFNRANQNELE